MKKLEDLFINIKQLNLDKDEVRDSLYRISDWLSVDGNKVEDPYVQNQLNFLDMLYEENKDYSMPTEEIIINDDSYIIEL